MALQFLAKNTTVLVQINIVIKWYSFVGVFCCRKSTRSKYEQFFLECRVSRLSLVQCGWGTPVAVMFYILIDLIYSPRPEWQKRCLQFSFLTADCLFPLHNNEGLQNSLWGVRVNEQYDVIGTLTHNLKYRVGNKRRVSNSED